MNLTEALRTGQGISLSEALSMGGKVTALGLTIVFSVLVILMIILFLFKVIFYKDPSKKKAPKAEETAVESVKAMPGEEAKAVDEEELIAVLTAAVAASLNTSTYNLKIKSYRRIDNKKPAWNMAGIRETIGNRF